MTVDKPKGGRLVGYARVSTEDQNLEMQLEALRKAGVQERFLYQEKVSAASRKRPAFNWALKTLRHGDTFIVHDLSRAGRDVRELLRTIDQIKEAGASLRSLTEGYLDDDTPMGTFMLIMRAAQAQLLRDDVRVKTARGVAAARRRGVKFGQPPKLNAKQRAQCRKWKREGLTVLQIVDRVKSEYKITVSHGAIQNYLTKRK